MSAVVDATLLSVFERSYEELVGFVAAKVGCAATAADIVQETYLRIAAAPAEGIDHPRSFMYRVAGNLAIDHLRQQQSRAKYVVNLELPEALHPATPSVEEQILQRERLVRLVRAIRELPPRCREVFILRRVENLHQSEIAERLGISRNMVEKHLRHALLYCLQQVDGDE
jgi:RNA polymerase sigma factor, sigma-70 family